MLDRVLMDVIETGKIRFFKCQPSFAIIVPNLATRRTVQTVDPFGGFFVQSSEHTRYAFGATRRTVRDEMIVIGKDRPSLESPAEFLRHRQKPAMQHRQPNPRTKMMFMLIGRHRNEKSAIVAEPMLWRMGP